MVSHHYPLTDREIRRLTLRQIRRKVANLPKVNPDLAPTPSDADASTSPDDTGNLHF